MLQYVVPKLGHTLREDFVINPAKQDMVPLEEWVLPWHTLLRSSMFVHLLDAELFPKWIEILYVWLASPGCKPDEVASWYVPLFAVSIVANDQVHLVEEPLPCSDPRDPRCP